MLDIVRDVASVMRVEGEESDDDGRRRPLGCQPRWRGLIEEYRDRLPGH